MTMTSKNMLERVGDLTLEVTAAPPKMLRFPEFFAFVGSGCLLVLELVAGRILAPQIGVSLYTWTSIIGVVLAGISIGNWLGGRIADRWPGRITLSTLYLFSALTTALILAFSRDLTRIAAPMEWPAMAQVLWLTTLLFFIPATILGTMTPMLVKLSLRSLGSAGRVVGRIQAAATFGSIVGTFITGFFLISWFGTRAIVAGVAGALVVLAVLADPPSTLRTRTHVAIVIVFLVAMTVVTQSPCLRESNYFCIQVGTKDDGNVLVLSLDHLAHGYVSVEDPTRLLYSYETLYEEVLAAEHKDGDQVDSFLIGGGTYTMPRWLEKHYAGHVLVAEIDPAVTEVAHTHLMLPRETTIETINDDARTVASDVLRDRRFDVVLGDAFNDAAIPYHLTTREFNELIKGRMEPDGVYMVNVVDGVDYSFLRSFIVTMRDTFHDVRLMAVNGVLPSAGANSTFVVAASDRTLPDTPSMLAKGALDAFVAKGRATLLTDDHVPVDQLLAPNFRQRLER
jgi:spermidine synthase